MQVEKILVKYEGGVTQLDVVNDGLDMGQTNPSDEEVMNAVMQKTEIDNLDGYVVDPPQAERNAGQHETITVLNIRPSAHYA